MKESENTFIITGTPQIYTQSSTARMLWSVCIWLLPATGWGIFLYGGGAIRILLVSIGAAIAIEGVVGLIRKEFTLYDGSACLTGLLIGLMLPPTVPLFIPFFAVFFALIVVKWSFGGLGKNWMNPAVAGWAFVSLSFPDQFRLWLYPSFFKGVDLVTSSTPLIVVKRNLLLGISQGSTPMELLMQTAFPRSLWDGAWTEWVNTKLLSLLGIVLPPGYIDFFFGFTPGAIGETSAFLLLLGTIALIGKGILPWQVPLSVCSVFGVLVYIFGGLPYGLGLGQGDVLFHLMSGGFLLGAFYIGTDLVTSPLTKAGLYIYGVGIGVLTFLIRILGAAPEGMGYAILFMNVFVPLINKYCTSNSKLLR
ncbi:MAG: RnfABCDGE type electron transport complex subunit D, partial [Spirochaetales bacterium]